MIGLELDVKEILRMGRVVLLTGLFQLLDSARPGDLELSNSRPRFPVCFGAHYLIFAVIEGAGLKFGSGSYAAS